MADTTVGQVKVRFSAETKEFDNAVRGSQGILNSFVHMLNKDYGAIAANFKVISESFNGMAGALERYKKAQNSDMTAREKSNAKLKSDMLELQRLKLEIQRNTDLYAEQQRQRDFEAHQRAEDRKLEVTKKRLQTIQSLSKDESKVDIALSNSQAAASNSSAAVAKANAQVTASANQAAVATTNLANTHAKAAIQQERNTQVNTQYQISLERTKQSQLSLQRALVTQQTALARSSEAFKSHSSSMLMFIKNITMAYYSMRSFISVIEKGVSFNTFVEEQTAAFTVFMKNADNAKQKLQELFEYAVQSPLSFKETVASSKQLLAYGFSADSLVDTMKVLGTVAKATGKSLEDMSYVYGTLMTQGRAYTRDLVQFAQRGIPIYDELSKVLKVQKTEIKQLVEEGKVGFNEIQQAFYNMTTNGGIYAGMLEEWMKTLSGQFSMLKDQLQLLSGDFAKPINAALLDIVKSLPGMLDKSRGAILTLGKDIASLIKMVSGLVNGLNVLIPVLKLLVAQFIAGKAISFLTTGMLSAIKVAQSLATVMGDLSLAVFTLTGAAATGSMKTFFTEFAGAITMLMANPAIVALSALLAGLAGIGAIKIANLINAGNQVRLEQQKNTLETDKYSRADYIKKSIQWLQDAINIDPNIPNASVKIGYDAFFNTLIPKITKDGLYPMTTKFILEFVDYLSKLKLIEGIPVADLQKFDKGYTEFDKYAEDALEKMGITHEGKLKFLTESEVAEITRKLDQMKKNTLTAATADVVASVTAMEYILKNATRRKYGAEPKLPSVAAISEVAQLLANATGLQVDVFERITDSGILKTYTAGLDEFKSRIDKATVLADLQSTTLHIPANLYEETVSGLITQLEEFIKGVDGLAFDTINKALKENNLQQYITYAINKIASLQKKLPGKKPTQEANKYAELQQQLAEDIAKLKDDLGINAFNEINNTYQQTLDKINALAESEDKKSVLRLDALKVQKLDTAKVQFKIDQDLQKFALEGQQKLAELTESVFDDLDNAMERELFAITSEIKNWEFTSTQIDVNGIKDVFVSKSLKKDASDQLDTILQIYVGKRKEAQEKLDKDLQEKLKNGIEEYYKMVLLEIDRAISIAASTENLVDDVVAEFNKRSIELQRQVALQDITIEEYAYSMDTLNLEEQAATTAAFKEQADKDREKANKDRKAIFEYKKLELESIIEQLEDSGDVLGVIARKQELALLELENEKMTSDQPMLYDTYVLKIQGILYDSAKLTQEHIKKQQDEILQTALERAVYNASLTEDKLDDIQAKLQLDLFNLKQQKFADSSTYATKEAELKDTADRAKLQVLKEETDKIIADTYDINKQKLQNLIDNLTDSKDTLQLINAQEQLAILELQNEKQQSGGMNYDLYLARLKNITDETARKTKKYFEDIQDTQILSTLELAVAAAKLTASAFDDIDTQLALDFYNIEKTYKNIPAVLKEKQNSLIAIAASDRAKAQRDIDNKNIQDFYALENARLTGLIATLQANGQFIEALVKQEELQILDVTTRAKISDTPYDQNLLATEIQKIRDATKRAVEEVRQGRVTTNTRLILQAAIDAAKQTATALDDIEAALDMSIFDAQETYKYDAETLSKVVESLQRDAEFESKKAKAEERIKSLTDSFNTTEAVLLMVMEDIKAGIESPFRYTEEMRDQAIVTLQGYVDALFNLRKQYKQDTSVNDIDIQAFTQQSLSEQQALQDQFDQKIVAFMEQFKPETYTTFAEYEKAITQLKDDLRSLKIKPVLSDPKFQAMLLATSGMVNDAIKKEAQAFTSSLIEVPDTIYKSAIERYTRDLAEIEKRRKEGKYATDAAAKADQDIVFENYTQDRFKAEEVFSQLIQESAESLLESQTTVSLYAAAYKERAAAMSKLNETLEKAPGWQGNAEIVAAVKQSTDNTTKKFEADVNNINADTASKLQEFIRSLHSNESETDKLHREYISKLDTLNKMYGVTGDTLDIELGSGWIEGLLALQKWRMDEIEKINKAARDKVDETVANALAEIDKLKQEQEEFIQSLNDALVGDTPLDSIISTYTNTVKKINELFPQVDSRGVIDPARGDALLKAQQALSKGALAYSGDMALQNVTSTVDVLVSYVTLLETVNAIAAKIPDTTVSASFLADAVAKANELKQNALNKLNRDKPSKASDMVGRLAVLNEEQQLMKQFLDDLGEYRQLFADELADDIITPEMTILMDAIINADKTRRLDVVKNHEEAVQDLLDDMQYSNRTMEQDQVIKNAYARRMKQIADLYKTKTMTDELTNEKTILELKAAEERDTALGNYYRGQAEVIEKQMQEKEKYVLDLEYALRGLEGKDRAFANYQATMADIAVKLANEIAREDLTGVTPDLLARARLAAWLTYLRDIAQVDKEFGDKFEDLMARIKYSNKDMPKIKQIENDYNTLMNEIEQLFAGKTEESSLVQKASLIAELNINRTERLIELEKDARDDFENLVQESEYDLMGAGDSEGKIIAEYTKKKATLQKAYENFIALVVPEDSEDSSFAWLTIIKQYTRGMDNLTQAMNREIDDLKTTIPEDFFKLVRKAEFMGADNKIEEARLELKESKRKLQSAFDRYLELLNKDSTANKDIIASATEQKNVADKNLEEWLVRTIAEIQSETPERYQALLRSALLGGIEDKILKATEEYRQKKIAFQKSQNEYILVLIAQNKYDTAMQEQLKQELKDGMAALDEGLKLTVKKIKEESGKTFNRLYMETILGTGENEVENLINKYDVMRTNFIASANEYLMTLNVATDSKKIAVVLERKIIGLENIDKQLQNALRKSKDDAMRKFNSLLRQIEVDSGETEIEQIINKYEAIAQQLEDESVKAMNAQIGMQDYADIFAKATEAKGKQLEKNTANMKRAIEELRASAKQAFDTMAESMLTEGASDELASVIIEYTNKARQFNELFNKYIESLDINDKNYENLKSEIETRRTEALEANRKAMEDAIAVLQRSVSTTFWNLVYKAKYGATEDKIAKSQLEYEKNAVDINIAANKLKFQMEKAGATADEIAIITKAAIDAVNDNTLAGANAIKNIITTAERSFQSAFNKAMVQGADNDYTKLLEQFGQLRKDLDDSYTELFGILNKDKEKNAKQIEALNTNYKLGGDQLTLGLEAAKKSLTETAARKFYGFVNFAKIGSSANKIAEIINSYTTKLNEFEQVQQTFITALKADPARAEELKTVLGLVQGVRDGLKQWMEQEIEKEKARSIKAFEAIKRRILLNSGTDKIQDIQNKYDATAEQLVVAYIEYISALDENSTDYSKVVENAAKDFVELSKQNEINMKNAIAKVKETGFKTLDKLLNKEELSTTEDEFARIDEEYDQRDEAIRNALADYELIIDKTVQFELDLFNYQAGRTKAVLERLNIARERAKQDLLDKKNKQFLDTVRDINYEFMGGTSYGEVNAKRDSTLQKLNEAYTTIRGTLKPNDQRTYDYYQAIANALKLWERGIGDVDRAKAEAEDAFIRQASPSLSILDAVNDQYAKLERDLENYKFAYGETAWYKEMKGKFESFKQAAQAQAFQKEYRNVMMRMVKEREALAETATELFESIEATYAEELLALEEEAKSNEIVRKNIEELRGLSKKRRDRAMRKAWAQKYDEMVGGSSAAWEQIKAQAAGMTNLTDTISDDFISNERIQIDLLGSLVDLVRGISDYLKPTDRPVIYPKSFEELNPKHMVPYTVPIPQIQPEQAPQDLMQIAQAIMDNSSAPWVTNLFASEVAMEELTKELQWYMGRSDISESEIDKILAVIDKLNAVISELPGNPKTKAALTLEKEEIIKSMGKLSWEKRDLEVQMLGTFTPTQEMIDNLGLVNIALSVLQSSLDSINKKLEDSNIVDSVDVLHLKQILYPEAKPQQFKQEFKEEYVFPEIMFPKALPPKTSEMMEDAFKAFFKMVADSLLRALGVNIDAVPQYASGTSGAKQGWALVGEKGPELVYMAGGETVVPNHKLDDYDISKILNKYAGGIGLPHSEKSDKALPVAEQLLTNTDYFAAFTYNMQAFAEMIRMLNDEIERIVAAQALMPSGSQGIQDAQVAVDRLQKALEAITPLFDELSSTSWKIKDIQTKKDNLNADNLGLKGLLIQKQDQRKSQSDKVAELMLSDMEAATKLNGSVTSLSKDIDGLNAQIISNVQQIALLDQTMAQLQNLHIGGEGQLSFDQVLQMIKELKSPKAEAQASPPGKTLADIIPKIDASPADIFKWLDIDTAAIQGLFKKMPSLDQLGAQLKLSTQNTEMGQMAFGGADPITMLVKSFADMLMSIESVTKVMNPFKTIFEATKEVIEPILDIGLSGIISSLVEVGTILGEVLTPILNLMNISFQQVAAYIKIFVLPVLQILGKALTWLSDKVIVPIGNIFIKLFNWIIDGLNALLGWLGVSIERLQELQTSTQIAAAEKFANTIEYLNDKLNDLINDEIQSVKDLYEVGAITAEDYKKRVEDLNAQKSTDDPLLLEGIEYLKTIDDILAWLKTYDPKRGGTGVPPGSGVIDEPPATNPTVPTVPSGGDDGRGPIFGGDREGFAVGSTYVPTSMLANVHKGEIIIPSSFSDGIRNGDLVLSSNGQNTGNNGITVVVNVSGSVATEKDLAKSIANEISKQTRRGYIQ